MSHGKPSRRWLIIETVLAIGIVIGVVLYFARVLDNEKIRDMKFAVRLEWLIPAGLLYLLAHLCWATFWVRLLHFEQVNVPWWIGIRTYYVSQFGKYIPGKLAVVAMRMGILRRFGGHPIPVAVTAVYETLTSMAAGALLAVIFLPSLGVLPEAISGRSTALFAVAALPIGLAVLNKLVVRIAKKRRSFAAHPLPAPSIFLLAQGLLHGACGYSLLALSLSFTMHALVPNSAALSTETYTVAVAAVTLSYVAGFVIIVAPGGLGAREFVLVAALTPPFTLLIGDTTTAAGMAVVVALVLRLTWTIAEVLLGLMLYVKKPTLPPLPPTTIPMHSAKPHGEPHA